MDADNPRFHQKHIDKVRYCQADRNETHHITSVAGATLYSFNAPDTVRTDEKPSLWRETTVNWSQKYTSRLKYIQKLSRAMHGAIFQTRYRMKYVFYYNGYGRNKDNVKQLSCIQQLFPWKNCTVLTDALYEGARANVSLCSLQCSRPTHRLHQGTVASEKMLKKWRKKENDYQ